MPRLNDDTLRPEEEFGGFEPGGENDETFRLERMDKYPGDMKRYFVQDAPAEPISESAPEAPVRADIPGGPAQEEVHLQPEITPVAPITDEKFEAANSRNPTVETKEKGLLFPWLAAAIVLLAIGGGWWYSNNNRNDAQQIAAKKEAVHVTTENNVAPEIVIDSTAAQTEILKTDTLAAESVTNIPKATIENSKSENTALKKKNADLARNAAAEEVKATQAENVTMSRQPVLKRAANGLYVVQIYSSPSRDDADEWLGRLREKSVASPVITSQKIRGQDWYRVRFGSYTTKEEAESAALKLGFAQSWVIQIR